MVYDIVFTTLLIFFYGLLSSLPICSLVKPWLDGLPWLPLFILENIYEITVNPIERVNENPSYPRLSEIIPILLL